MSEMSQNSAQKRESMEFDVAIIGAGAAGLSAAIRLKQIAPDMNICVLEKGSEVGAHILSGAVLEPRALNELIPDWKEKNAPLNVPVTKDKFMFLGKKWSIKLPIPPKMHNKGNYIISLGNFCRWLASQAENLGVEIFPGFPASDILFDENGAVTGVITGEFGRARDGSKKDGFQDSMEIRAKYTLFAEGCRGSLTKKLEEKFDLRSDCDPQTYAIGIKELWEIPAENHREGEVMHSIGWPLSNDTYGGSFLYHAENNQISIGFVTGLDYKNPHLNPYEEFQRFKTHPKIRKHLIGGKRIAYGARALNEGGFQAIPKLTFKGGALIGCAAGFMNVAKIKGTHTAMKSAMLAAESVAKAIAENDGKHLHSYEENLEKSWVYEELREVRNIRPSFKCGLFFGLIYSAIDSYIFRGRAPWTFSHHKDNESLIETKKSKQIQYPKPDGEISFDLMSSVFISNTNHEEDQPVHLKLKACEVAINTNLAIYDSQEQRYCPAGVYEIVTDEASGSGGKALKINAQNCLHCKSCDIKDPTQNITWTTPEGGGGPNYPNM